jgi:hypothetical protein
MWVRDEGEIPSVRPLKMREGVYSNPADNPADNPAVGPR